MRIFVTGATGFVGSAVVRELVGAGHQVLGLCRSDDKAAALTAAGAEPHRGDTADLASLEAGVAQSDGVIHLAFNHDFSNYLANCEADRRVVAALGSALAGSDRPLVVTSGTGMAGGAPGRPATEDDPALGAEVMPRAASEEAAAQARVQDTRVSVMRLPQVHDTVVQGLVTPAIQVFREKGVCAYIGEGLNRWPAAHVTDVARLYRLAVEKAAHGACYHAVAEEGVAMRVIAEAVGARLDLPVRSIGAEEAHEFFGWMAMFATLDLPASSTLTRKALGWTPTGPGLIADLGGLVVSA